MRILHVIPTMGSGGAERQLSYLAGALRELGHDVHIALLRGGPNLARLETSGATIHWLKATGNHDPRIVIRLFALVRALKPDVVHTWIPQMDILGGLVASVTMTPWILSERSATAMYAPSVKTRLRRTLARFTKAIISNSEGGLDYWATSNSKARRAVIPNGVPFEEIDAALPTLPSSESSDAKPFLLHVGRLSLEKNVAAILRSMALTRGNARLILCGDGPEAEHLLGMRDALGLHTRVEFRGFDSNVWGLMKTAAGLVTLSRVEGQPNAVLEAMACGCPIVASDIPAHRELLDGETATLVNANDPTAVARALDYLSSGLTEVRSRAAKARELSRERAFSHIARQYLQAYQMVA